MFKLKINNLETLYHNGKHYLYADSDMFGECKFGDLMMYGVYLFFLKKYLIRRRTYGFNEGNLFFIFNRRNKVDSVKECLLSKIKGERFISTTSANELRSILYLFNNVWGGIEVNESGKYNIRQIVSGGNIWSFKAYLDSISKTINPKDSIIDPSRLLVSRNQRRKIYFNPVRGKKYNIERNMDDEEIVTIINNHSARDTINLITKGTDINFTTINDKTKCRLINIDNRYSWDDIVLDLLSDCKLYISGDCGLTHFVSLIGMIYKPEMEIYYRTRSCKNKVELNEFDNYEATFTPYSPYGSLDKIKII